MSIELFQYQLNILLEEIKIIHSRIGSFDTLSFQVKGWTATLWAALVGYAVSQNKPKVILLSIPLIIILWILDAFFKSYQHYARLRMSIIEDFINRPEKDPKPSLAKAFLNQSFKGFIIHDPMCKQTRNIEDREFNKYFKRKTSIIRAIFTSNICIIYIALIVSSIFIVVYLNL